MADTPRLTIRCEYPETDLPPTEVTFRLSPSYGIHDAREAHEWFIEMMREHEEVRGRDGWGWGASAFVLGARRCGG